MLRALGMTRAVDELGRIVIPIDVRRNFGIDTKDMLEIFVDTDKEYIVFHKALRMCIMCGSQENLYQLSNEKYICGDCVKENIQKDR